MPIEDIVIYQYFFLAQQGFRLDTIFRSSNSQASMTVCAVSGDRPAWASHPSAKL